jgi:hypothetical protein
MPKIKFSPRTSKNNKQDILEKTNQKNNWVLEKRNVEKQDFLVLRSNLFKTNRGALDLKDKEFYTFAAISYFFFDETGDPIEDAGDEPCIRILRVFLQLKTRRHLDDVMAKMEIEEMEEYDYDPLEDSETAVDAKKAFYAVVGNCQELAYAGSLRIKVFYSFFCFLLFKILYPRPDVRSFFSHLIRGRTQVLL